MNPTDEPLLPPTSGPPEAAAAAVAAHRASRAALARRAARWAGIATAVLGLIALLAVGLLVIALRQEATVAWTLGRVPGLKAEGLGGTYYGGRQRAERLVWTSPDGSGRLTLEGVEMDRRDWRLRPWQGAWFDLDFESVAVRSARWESLKPGSQSKPPATLRLPFGLRIDKLTIGTLQVDQLPAVTGLQARVALGDQAGALHRIDQLALHVDGARIRGGASIGADAPMKVDAALQAERDGLPGAPGRWATEPWAAEAKASGPLGELGVTLSLQGRGSQGEQPQLDARGQVRPFEPWPFGELDLKARALDLAALGTALPRTRLDGSAQVRAAQRAGPADVRAELTNREPGRWDAGALPVRRLALQGRAVLGAGADVALPDWQLDLADAAGPAGRITGKATLKGGHLELQAALDGVRPQRLDARAPALLASGPLKLDIDRIDEPAQARARFDLDLTGRMLDPRGRPAGEDLQLAARGQGSASAVQLDALRLAAGPAGVSGALTAEAARGGFAQGGHLVSDLSLTRFDPRRWWPRLAASAEWRLDGRLDTDLRWQAPATPAQADWQAWLSGLAGRGRLRFDAPSVAAGVPLVADVTMTPEGNRQALKATLDAAGNRIELDAALAGAGAAPRLGRRLEDGSIQGRLKVDAPRLAALLPWKALAGTLAPAAAPAITANWPQDGALSLDLQAQGPLRSARVEGAARATGLRATAWRVDALELRGQGGGSLQAPLTVALQGRGLAQGEQRIDRLQFDVGGTLAEHAIQLAADTPLAPPASMDLLLGPAGRGTRLAGGTRARWLPAPGGRPGTGRWVSEPLQLRAQALDAKGQPLGSGWAALDTPSASLTLGAGGAVLRAELAPGRLRLGRSTGLTWSELTWQAAAPGGRPRFVARANLESMEVVPLLRQWQPAMNWGGDLRIGGRIDLTGDPRLRGEVVLERLGGDLQVTDELGQVSRMGLTEARVVASASPEGHWQIAQGLAGTLIGEMAGAQQIQVRPGQDMPDAGSPIQGVLEMRVRDLGVWGAWVPAGWRLGGQMNASASVAGTLGTPDVQGRLMASRLSLRNVLEGVELRDGDVSVAFNGQRVAIERFLFRGGDGTLTLSGQGTLGSEPTAQVRAVADRFRVLGRLDRRLVASGSADATIGRESLQLDGRVVVDEALYDVSRGNAPALDADVRVRRASDPPEPADAPPPRSSALMRNARINLAIGLGERTRVRGLGVDARLVGDLTLTSPQGRLAMRGQIRAVDGTYKAYGQNLEIERGLINFSGPIDNPRLDVRAVRPNLDVLVGVAVTGTAQAPRIRLFSEPDLPDFDKLSWLVLGREPDGLGRADTALLQGAALALLSGSEGGGLKDTLLQNIGLTDFSLRQSETGDARDTIVSLGKQLSRRWYVGYERGLNATTGTWQLIYRVAQRFTLRAQSGGENSIDAIMTWRWGLPRSAADLQRGSVRSGAAANEAAQDAAAEAAKAPAAAASSAPAPR